MVWGDLSEAIGDYPSGVSLTERGAAMSEHDKATRAGDLARVLIELNTLLTRIEAEQHVLVEMLTEERVIRRDMLDRRVAERLAAVRESLAHELSRRAGTRE